MGCLNANSGFDHWFANIHLSGPCNRSCYFCIGQWMPGQDMNNNVDGSDLLGYDDFVKECRDRGITEVNITGTNTDPLIKRNLEDILIRLRNDGFSKIGIRTNGVLHSRLIKLVDDGLIDKASISITSFDNAIYAKTMGGKLTNEMLVMLRELGSRGFPIKVNTVLCPENAGDDLFNTITMAGCFANIEKINFREPYGQSHIGDPFKDKFKPVKMVYGNPCYLIGGVECTYWDVHYTEVESVNLYADGHISVDYPVSLGHSESLLFSMMVPPHGLEPWAC